MSKKSVGWLAFGVILGIIVIVACLFPIGEESSIETKVLVGGALILLGISALTALIIAVTGSTMLLPPPGSKKNPNLPNKGDRWFDKL